MRISTPWMQQLGVNALLQQQTQISRTQQQLATGNELLTPADDPVAAVRILDFEANIAKTDQYQNNAETAKARLALEEAALEHGTEALMRLKDLAIQANSGALSVTDKKAIDEEVQFILQEMVGVANSKNANGEYLFAGYYSHTPPIQYNTESLEYDYWGGNIQREINISPERNIDDGDLGSEVFVDIASSGFSAEVGGKKMQSLFKTIQVFSDALNGKYETPQGKLTGTRQILTGIDYSASAANFTLTADNDPAKVANIVVNQDYSDFDAMISDINGQIATQTLSEFISVRRNGYQLELVSKSEGDTSSIQIDSVSGTFLTDMGFNDGQVGVGATLDDMGSINGGQDISAGLDYSVTPASFKLTANDNIAIDIDLTLNYPDLPTLVADINSQITAAAHQLDIEAYENGNVIGFRSLALGADSLIQIHQLDGSFLSDAGFVDQQLGKGIEQIYPETLESVIKDIGAVQERFIKTTVAVGARLRTIDNQTLQNEQFVLDMETQLSEIRDLDYVEAISRFNQQELALEAAQQSFSRIQRLSLFNFL